MQLTNTVQSQMKDNITAGQVGEEAEVRFAVREQLKEEIRAAIRDYLGGSDARGENLSKMLEVSKTLSEKELASTTQTEKTILFSDYAGSCSMFHELGDVAAHELIQEYFGICNVAVLKFSGEIIKYTGDGMLALFSRPEHALKASLFSRNMFSIHNKKFPLLPINARMGVNVGVVIQDEIDAYGTSVNLSARICDASKPGGILCSNIVRLRIQETGLFNFTNHSNIHVKGFTHPIKTHFLKDRRPASRLKRDTMKAIAAGA